MPGALTRFFAVILVVCLAGTWAAPWCLSSAVACVDDSEVLTIPEIKELLQKALVKFGSHFEAFSKALESRDYRVIDIRMVSLMTNWLILYTKYRRRLTVSLEIASKEKGPAASREKHEKICAEAQRWVDEMDAVNVLLNTVNDNLMDNRLSEVKKLISVVDGKIRGLFISEKEGVPGAAVSEPAPAVSEPAPTVSESAPTVSESAPPEANQSVQGN